MVDWISSSADALLPGLYPIPPRSALLMNRGGRFDDATDALAPGLRTVGMVTSALWSDADGDGWLDLIIALEWGGVRYWHNQEGEGFEDLSDDGRIRLSGIRMVDLAGFGRF